MTADPTALRLAALDAVAAFTHDGTPPATLDAAATELAATILGLVDQTGQRERGPILRTIRQAITQPKGSTP